MSERVKVNVRVPSQVKDAYEERIRNEKPQIRPYAGTILERELKIHLEIGGLSELFDALPSRTSESNQKKDIPQIPAGGKSVVVQYRIDPSIRSRLMSLSNPKKNLSRIMWMYALEMGYVDTMIDAVVEDDRKYTNLSATERRKEQIKDWLLNEFGDGEKIEVPFEIQDFDRAAEAAANLSTKSYARENYLRAVLVELNVMMTMNGIVPVPVDGADPTIPDPRHVPIEALTSDEMVSAVVDEVLDHGPVSVEDIRSMFRGSVSTQRARELMAKADDQQDDVHLSQEGLLRGFEKSMSGGPDESHSIDLSDIFDDEE